MTADGLGDVDDGLDAAVCGPEVPSFEEVFGLVRRLAIEILEDGGSDRRGWSAGGSE